MTMGKIAEWIAMGLLVVAWTIIGAMAGYGWGAAAAVPAQAAAVNRVIGPQDMGSDV